MVIWWENQRKWKTRTAQKYQIWTKTAQKYQIWTKTAQKYPIWTKTAQKYPIWTKTAQKYPIWTKTEELWKGSPSINHYTYIELIIYAFFSITGF